MPARSYWDGNFGQSRLWNRLEASFCSSSSMSRPKSGILVRHRAVRKPLIAPIALYWRGVRQPKGRGVYVAIWRLLFDDGYWTQGSVFESH
jgi:hypothetical protein